MIDLSKIAYRLTVMDSGGKQYNIKEFVTGLGWEENKNEISVRTSFTAKNDKTSAGRLSELIKPGWEYLNTHGGSDPLYEDGFNMNIVRNHIIYDKRKCQEELEEKDYPKEYFRETPPQVDNYYMARMDEIRENAKSSLLVYKADENYIFIMQNLEKLNERQKEQCHIGAVMGYITGLQSFINGNDYVGMRRHERPERYQDSFKYCRKQIEEYLKEIPKEKVLPTGQLTLFDLFDMSGG